MRKELEKCEKIILKVFMVGGSVMYFAMPWSEVQKAMREFKYYLRWKYTMPTEENQKKLIEESEFKRAPFVNYFFQRKDGDLSGVVDFCAVAGITHDEIPPEEEKKNEDYWKAMTKMAEVQAEFLKKMIEDHDHGNEWKKEKGEETPEE